MAKANATGRSGSDSHVRLYDWLTKSPAWRALSGNAMKLLVYVASFENGRNNGELFMSERLAAEGTGISKKTIHKLFLELQEKGFLVCTAKGSFHAKQSLAAQWRLTWKAWPAHSQAPTNEWRQWKPKENPREKFLPATGVISSQGESEPASTGVKTTPEPQSEPQKSAKPDWEETTPHIIASGKGSFFEGSDHLKIPAGRFSAGEAA